jgi:ribosome biogenesis protein NSA1
LDRFFRLHSVGSPDTQIDKKGEVLEKVYTKSIPTAVVWDPTLENHIPDSGKEDEENSNEVWERMQHVDDSNDEDDSRRNRDKKSRRIK